MSAPKTIPLQGFPSDVVAQAIKTAESKIKLDAAMTNSDRALELGTFVNRLLRVTYGLRDD